MFALGHVGRIASSGPRPALRGASWTFIRARLVRWRRSPSWRRGLDIQRLVLVGIGLTATLTAATAYLLVNARIQDAASAQVWLSGSLTSRGWEHARPVVLDAGWSRRPWPCCSCVR